METFSARAMVAGARSGSLSRLSAYAVAAARSDCGGIAVGACVRMSPVSSMAIASPVACVASGPSCSARDQAASRWARSSRDSGAVEGATVRAGSRVRYRCWSRRALGRMSTLQSVGAVYATVPDAHRVPPPPPSWPTAPPVRNGAAARSGPPPVPQASGGDTGCDRRRTGARADGRSVPARLRVTRIPDATIGCEPA
jgi:hypothetical protein